MAVPVNIRANVRVPFPALVQANFPLTVNKANGIWTFNVDIANLADQIAGQIGGIPPNYRAVTLTPISVISNPLDMIIGVDTNAINAAWTFNLPLATSRGGFPLTVVDITGKAGTFAGTFVPAGTDTIEGVVGPQVLLNINDQAITFVPVTQGAGAPGWIITYTSPSQTGYAAPTALLGLAAIPGSAPSAMRSDAAPALNQAITPTWTGQHNFSAAAGALIKGTTTNDNAAAGYVGEYIESRIPNGTAQSLSNNVPLNVTSISLTAGDWDVGGSIVFTGSSGTAVNTVSLSLSDASASLQVTPVSRTLQLVYNAQTIFLGGTMFHSIGPTRFSLGSTTTVFLVGSMAFSAAAASTSGGHLWARRRR